MSLQRARRPEHLSLESHDSNARSCVAACSQLTSGSPLGEEKELKHNFSAR